MAVLCDEQAAPVAAEPLLQVQVLAVQAWPSRRKPILQDAHTDTWFDVHAVPVAALPLLQVHELAAQSSPWR